MKRELLRKLPKVDYLLQHSSLEDYGRKTDYFTFSESVKEGINFFREKILNDEIDKLELDFENNKMNFEEIIVEKIAKKIKEILKEKSLYSLRKVINGTGTIIHTNMGRSILPKEIGEHIFQTAFSYNNLEYNLETGKRGSRNEHLEKLICEVTGAEGALVVNNNAAAVVLCINEFARGKEIVVSRGELIEIGGSFRIPEIMKFAGAELAECGTTNKTYIEDYENTVNENTAMLLKVHTSNYKIEGFTNSPSREEISALGREKKIISMEDMGSGVLIDFSKYGISKETTVQEVLKSGIDLITFSGDKLLGGCQAGIILGKKELIERLKKNQYLRTVRVDKITIAVLESLFRIYRDEREAVKKIPTLRYITENISQVRERAEHLSKILSEKNISHKIIKTEVSIGGGSMPGEIIESYGIEFDFGISTNEIEKNFRKSNPAVIGRIEKNKFILDMKTIENEDIITVGETAERVYKKIREAVRK